MTNRFLMTGVVLIISMMTLLTLVLTLYLYPEKVNEIIASYMGWG